MTRQKQAEGKPTQALRSFAMGYPEVQEGTVCNKCAFKARDKAFLFMGSDDQSYHVMVKLRDSLAESSKLAGQDPSCYKVGGHNWVTATFRHDQYPPPGLLERWIDESYRLLAPKQLVAVLQERGRQGRAKKIAKKRRPQK